MSTGKFANGEFDFEAVINRAKLIAKVKTQNELAEALGMSTGDLSNRKKRGTLPFERLVELAYSRNVSVDWLLTGTEKELPSAHVAGVSLSPRHQALLDLFNALPEEKQREAFSALEDKKRLLELEDHYQELKAALDSLKRTG